MNIKYKTLFNGITRYAEGEYKTMSTLLNFYGLAISDAKVTSIDDDVTGIKTRHIYLNTTPIITDIKELEGCPEDHTIFACAGADDYGINLTHEISNGWKYNNCNVNTYTEGKGEEIAIADKMALSQTYQQIDTKLWNVIRQTAPRVTQFATIDGTNVLDAISYIGNAVINNPKAKSQNWGKQDIMVFVPNKYKGLVEQAFLQAEKVALTFEVLENGIEVAKVDGFNVNFNNEFEYIWASLKDAYDIVLACNNLGGISYSSPNGRTIFREFWARLGGGYKYRFKSTMQDREWILGIAILEESTPGEGITYDVEYSDYEAQGLRIIPVGAVAQKDAEVESAYDELYKKTINNLPIIYISGVPYTGTDNVAMVSLSGEQTTITNAELKQLFNIIGTSQVGEGELELDFAGEPETENALPIVGKIITATDKYDNASEVILDVTTDSAINQLKGEYSPTEQTVLLKKPLTKAERTSLKKELKNQEVADEDVIDDLSDERLVASGTQAAINANKGTKEEK